MLSWGRQSLSTVPRSSLPGTATSYACVSACTRSDREMVCLKGHERRVQLSLYESNEEGGMGPFEGPMFPSS